MAHNWSKPIRRIRAARARQTRQETRTQAAIEAQWEHLVRRLMKRPDTSIGSIHPPRECLWCLAESGAPRTRGATHGVCRAHTAAMRAAWFGGMTTTTMAQPSGSM